MEEQKKLFDALTAQDSLRQLQRYVKDVIRLRGFAEKPICEELLLLTEEVGELAKAIRKSEMTMAIDEAKIEHYESVESEVADVFIVLASICNALEIDLFDAMKQKEALNIHRVWK